MHVLHHRAGRVYWILWLSCRPLALMRFQSCGQLKVFSWFMFPTSRAAKNSLACVQQFLQAKHLGWHWCARIVWPYMLQSRTSFSFQASFQAGLLNICLYGWRSRSSFAFANLRKLAKNGTEAALMAAEKTPPQLGILQLANRMASSAAGLINRESERVGKKSVRRL